MGKARPDGWNGNNKPISKSEILDPLKWKEQTLKSVSVIYIVDVCIISEQLWIESRGHRLHWVVSCHHLSFDLEEMSCCVSS